MADKPSSVTAVCPVCGMSRFQGSGATLEPTDVLTCESCGLKLSYAFLQSRKQESTMPAPMPLEATKPKKKAAKARRTKRSKK